MRIILCFTIPCCTVSYHRPLSHGPIIDGYEAAACIPVSANRKVRGPHTREWETLVTLSDASMVMVLGYQMPGGRVTVRYLRTGRELEAANAGDYVYPSDVRFNPQTNLCLLRHRAWRAELPMRLGCLSTIYTASV